MVSDRREIPSENGRHSMSENGFNLRNSFNTQTNYKEGGGSRLMLGPTKHDDPNFGARLCGLQYVTHDENTGRIHRPEFTPFR